MTLGQGHGQDPLLDHARAEPDPDLPPVGQIQRPAAAAWGEQQTYLPEPL
jgi:hypothetical protein